MSKLFSTVTAWIAKVGVNPDFIAFNAHAGFAYALVHTFGWRAALVVIPAAAAKEFWFDATYEVPKQTFSDNAMDFAGYATGVVLALLALRFV